MYITERPNSVMAVDAVTGRVFWKYRHTNDERALVCCGANNRGVAILGDKVFMGTLDAHLLALDRVNGELLWKQEVGDVARSGPERQHGPHRVSSVPPLRTGWRRDGLHGGDGRGLAPDR